MCQTICTLHYKNGKGNYVKIKTSEFCHVIRKITDHEKEAKKWSRLSFLLWTALILRLLCTLLLEGSHSSCSNKMNGHKYFMCLFHGSCIWHYMYLISKFKDFGECLSGSSTQSRKIYTQIITPRIEIKCEIIFRRIQDVTIKNS